MPPESPRSLQLSVNGQVVRSGAATLAELLAERQLDSRGGGFACAVNGSFVARARWAQQPLADGDCVDIVAPVVGG